MKKKELKNRIVDLEKELELERETKKALQKIIETMKEERHSWFIPPCSIPQQPMDKYWYPYIYGKGFAYGEIYPLQPSHTTDNTLRVIATQEENGVRWSIACEQ